MSEPTLPSHLHPLRQALSGQYTVERSLGVGGMGTVLLGRDVTLDREVAIKVISPEITVTPTLRERFLREARTVAKLRHPNIVAVYAAGETNGLLYFVMECVPGESLSAYLRREGRCSPEMTATILRDLADALDHAHRQGVIHRDVKPDNILLDAETGRAKLTDFGVARALVSREERLTGTGLVLGTPRYMSPEQAAGDEADGRSDLYSLGLVGYEMLTGAPAFAGSGPSVIMKQISERPQPVAEKVEGVPPALATAIDRAIEKNPSDRWPDGGAMAAAIDPATSYRPRTGSTRRIPWYRRARLVGAGAAVLALLTVTGLVIARSDAPAGDPRQSILVVPFENLTRSEEIDWLREGSVNMLTFDLSQWRELTVVGYERTLDLLRDQELLEARQIGLEQAREMAREAGVGTVITGSFEQSRDSLIVRARLYDVSSRSGEALAETRAAAARDRDPRELFDRLSHTLLALPSTGHASATATTPSLEAYRQYLRGLTLLNSWQLDAADSAFARAIEADSTFALAYYKAALTRGWQGTLYDSTAVRYAQLAARHAAGLPARERALIEAYLLFTEEDFDAAQERYRQLVATDSADAEAWYGLGDAHYHDVPQGGMNNAEQLAANWTRALRAFNRTLALDSTFHLAYAHNVDIFNQTAQLQSGVVLVGDSVIAVNDTAKVRAFGAARLQAARRDALARSIESARHWLFSDPNAERAYASLSASQAAAGDYPAAVATLEEAMRRPATARAVFPYRIAVYKMAQRAPDALESLREAMRTHPADSLRQDGGAMVMPTLFSAMAVAAYAGSTSELAQVEALMRSVVGDLRVHVVAGTPIFGRNMVASAGRFLRVSMGVSPEATQRSIDEFVSSLSSLPDSAARFMRTQNQPLPYLAYLAYREPRYKSLHEEWSGQRAPELEALAAIGRGDTTQARAIARQFRPIDTTQGPLSGILRPFAEAEVLAELGDAEAAIRIYEAVDRWRFGTEFADVRYPLWVRSWLARGALYERLGQRDQAIAAYRRFLGLWENADGGATQQVTAARTALMRLGDNPR